MCQRFRESSLCLALHSVVLPAEIFEMRKSFKSGTGKAEIGSQKFLRSYELFAYKTYVSFLYLFVENIKIQTMYVYCNIQVRKCCCSIKVISITYSECVCS